MITSQSCRRGVSTHTQINTRQHTRATHSPPAPSLRIPSLAKTPLKKGADKQGPITDQHINLWPATSRQSGDSHAERASSVSTLCYYICKQPCSFYTYYKYMAGQDHKCHCRCMEMYPVKRWSSRTRKQQIKLPNWVISVVIKDKTRLCAYSNVHKNQSTVWLKALSYTQNSHYALRVCVWVCVCTGSRRLCKKEVETKRESKEGHITPWIKPLSVPMLQ